VGLTVSSSLQGSGRIRQVFVGRSATASIGWALSFDQSANAQHGPRISAQGSSVEVFVIPTNEEIVIARATQAIALSGEGSDPVDIPKGRQAKARTS
jgi:hypothetical protein